MVMALLGGGLCAGGSLYLDAFPPVNSPSSLKTISEEPSPTLQFLFPAGCPHGVTTATVQLFDHKFVDLLVFLSTPLPVE